MEEGVEAEEEEGMVDTDRGSVHARLVQLALVPELRFL